ncbi:unnamed protein product [Amaranthus hypochondriacus]
MAATINYAVGSLVWVEDHEEAWLDGEVLELNGEELKVKCATGKTVAINASRVHPKDPEAPFSGVDDMTKLAYLHEPGVLDNLKRRYDINEIYTYTGNILIAVNPFQRLPHLYDGDMKEKYKGAALGDLNPHPFAIADSAYRLMVNEGISQAILVSGESGAGKTESTKSLMQYLAFMGGRSGVEGRSVEQQVLESNPVLEAFGNAKTVRNNNSSRFGKFVELQFDERGRISGAAIRTYLLERSRVCQVSDPERNYHCFYMLCSAPKEDIEKFKLDSPRNFHYLNQSNCYEVDVIDDAKEYVATRRAMNVVGIGSHEQDAIFRVVAAILHLGNIEFAKGIEPDSSEAKDEKARFHLKTAAELFMCNEKTLEDSLCKRVIVTRGESITKNLDPEAATVNRDALAKIVYSRLFDWLVNKINSSIGQDPDSKFLIGVLDIYGFETFKTNSFEQFCINLTNEKLQQHFNQHVFKMEQEEYTREEIDWSYIEFVDNQDVLDLIEKKPGGIIALLDEACMFPRSTHETFAEKLYQTFTNHKRFSKPKLSRTDFTISHYAGEVTYQTDLFLDKNKDYVVPEHQELLNASKCAFVASLFPPLPEDSTKSSKFSSIGTGFKHQLQSLLETLNATEPHYIRCVKPNNLLKPAIFENDNVLHQLRCGGVMEAIRISCAGFPTRKPFHEFIDRCRILAPEVSKGSCDEIIACRKILEKVQLEGYQIGKTKVFLRAGQMAEIDARRNEILGQSATIIQKQIRTFFFRRWFKQMRGSAIQVQALCRGQIARSVFEHQKREAACLKIQKELRCHLARKFYLELYSSVVKIESGMRGMAARRELHFRRQMRAATIIQTQCRKYIAQLFYRRIRRAAIVTQCAWRVKLARRELRHLKMAAKEAGLLKEAKDKLEKEVEELASRLQLERRMRVELEILKEKENGSLQQDLQEMEKQLLETKTLLMKEREEVVKAVKRENESLQQDLQEMEKQLQETKTLLMKEREEAVKRENESLQHNLQKMQKQLQETNTLLMKEREEAVKAVKRENESLRQDLQEMEKQLQETKTSMKEREEVVKAVKRENESLQQDLQEMEMQLQETKTLLMKEREEVVKDVKRENKSLQKDLQEMEKQLQETKTLLTKEREEAVKAVIKENESLQQNLQEMENQLQETKAMLMNEREETMKRAHEDVSDVQAPIFDDQLISQITVENEQLKKALQEMEKQLLETKTLLLKEREEAIKEGHEDVHNIQAPIFDDQLMTKITVENEQLKELVSSLQGKIDETEKKFAETSKMNQVSHSDNGLMIKLAVENKQHKEMASSLENKIDDTEKKYAETSKLSEDFVSDNEVINRLASENQQLKETVSSLEQKIDETQQRYEETSKLSEERSKQAKETEAQMIELKTTKQRLEEKIASMETQHKSKMSDYPSFGNGYMNETIKDLPSGTPRKLFGTESLRKSQMERQRELSDSLIRCVSGDVGFSQGKPVAAFTMYKCLLHWKSFEAERTNVFDRLTELISSAFQNSNNNSHLAYWLSNASTLLFLLQRSFKANKDWKPPQPPTFFGRMAQGFRSPSSASLQIDIVRPVEAKQPALLFKQQLTAYVEMIFGIIKDNFKEELSPLVSSCIQIPKKLEVDSTQDNCWQGIIDCLDSFLKTLKENHVPMVLAQKIFMQLFSCIDVQLFNSILLDRECCTFRNGEHVKAGLDILETWCGEATEEFTGSSWDELKHTRQAIDFLLINQKCRITYEDLTSDLCPLLSVQQLYRICTTYWDEDYNTSTVSEEVISSLKSSMPEENEDEMDSDKTNKELILNDNSSIPLSVEDLSVSPEERDFAGVKPAPKLLENPDFQFLQD